MKLTGTQIRHLRGLAHHKRSVVTVGLSGLTKGVIKELDSALTAHELVKIKLPAGSRLDKQTMLHRLCASTTATSIQLIGRIGIIYRPGDPPVIPLPGATRPS
jgi:RNA-binding protein